MAAFILAVFAAFLIPGQSVAEIPPGTYPALYEYRITTIAQTYQADGYQAVCHQFADDKPSFTYWAAYYNETSDIGSCHYYDTSNNFYQVEITRYYYCDLNCDGEQTTPSGSYPDLYCPNLCEDCASESPLTLSGEGTIPPSFYCNGACSFTLVENEFYGDNPQQQGIPSWIATYAGTGEACESQTPLGTPFSQGTPECADSYIGEICIPDDPQPGEDCVTLRGVTTCFDTPGEDCIDIGGERWCMESTPPNCGTVNGELICIDSDGPEDSAPPGCIVGSNGEMVCLEEAPTKEETTTTETTENPDGSTTTTETTTGSDGTVTITVTTTSADGATTTTATTGSGAEEFPSVPEADNDQYSSQLDTIFDQLTEGMGQDDPGDPGFTNPLSMPSGSCSQVSGTLFGHAFSFPGPTACTLLNKGKEILSWLFYLLTAVAIVHIALQKPGG
jgi:hypothetical protein